MEGQEILGYEIGKMREAKFLLDAAQRHLAGEFDSAEPHGNPLRLVVPLVLGMAGALAWLMVR